MNMKKANIFNKPNSATKGRVPSAGKILKSTALPPALAAATMGGSSQRSNLALVALDPEFSLHGLKKEKRLPHKLNPLDHKSKKRATKITNMSDIEVK